MAVTPVGDTTKQGKGAQPDSHHLCECKKVGRKCPVPAPSLLLVWLDSASDVQARLWANVLDEFTRRPGVRGGGRAADIECCSRVLRMPWPFWHVERCLATRTFKGRLGALPKVGVCRCACLFTFSCVEGSLLLFLTASGMFTWQLEKAQDDVAHIMTVANANVTKLANPSQNLSRASTRTSPTSNFASANYLSNLHSSCTGVRRFTHLATHAWHRSEYQLLPSARKIQSPGPTIQEFKSSDLRQVAVAFKEA